MEAQYSGIAHCCAESHALFGAAGKTEAESNHTHWNLEGYQANALHSEKIPVFLLKLYRQISVSLLLSHSIGLVLIQKETSYLL